MDFLIDCRSLNPLNYEGRLETRGVILHRTIKFPNVNSFVKSYANTSEYAAGSYTGGKIPYHIVVGLSGRPYWFVDLDKAVPGAAPVNRYYIQIALEGDFRTEYPTARQLSSLYKLLHEVEPHTVVRHDDVREIPKGCPGENLKVEYIEKVVCS